MRYFIFDTETGGIKKENSLLTLFGAIVDQQFNILDEIDLKIKPGNHRYVVTSEGLEINKIDLVEHDKTAEYEAVCGQKLKDFIKKHKVLAGNELFIGGNNVHYDIMMVEEHLIFDFEDFFSRQRLDTGTLGLLLKNMGMFPQDKKISLANLAEYFDIKFEKHSHDAKSDVLVTIEVLKCLQKKFGFQKTEQNQ